MFDLDLNEDIKDKCLQILNYLQHEWDGASFKPIYELIAQMSDSENKEDFIKAITYMLFLMFNIGFEEGKKREEQKFIEAVNTAIFLRTKDGTITH